SAKCAGSLLLHPDILRQLLDLAEFGHGALTKTNPNTSHQATLRLAVPRGIYTLSAEMAFSINCPPGLMTPTSMQEVGSWNSSGGRHLSGSVSPLYQALSR